MGFPYTTVLRTSSRNAMVGVDEFEVVLELGDRLVSCARVGGEGGVQELLEGAG